MLKFFVVNNIQHKIISRREFFYMDGAGNGYQWKWKWKWLELEMVMGMETIGIGIVNNIQW